MWHLVQLGRLCSVTAWTHKEALDTAVASLIKCAPEETESVLESNAEGFVLAPVLFCQPGRKRRQTGDLAARVIAWLLSR